MTVAATSSFNPAVTYLITEAYRDLDIIAEDETPTSGQFDSALFKLNSLVKGLEATGIHVWTEEEGIVFLQPFQQRYTIGAPTGPVANSADAFAWVQNALSSSYSAAASAVVLTSAIGFVAGANIGIVLSSGVVFWTTINGAPSGNTVTLTAPLPGPAAAGDVVLTYPAAGEINRPLKVPNARLLTYSSNVAGQPGQETPMTILSRQEYMDLPNKGSIGVPTQWFYTPQRDTGYLFVWPVPTTAAWAVRFTWYRPLADLLTPANTMDFPQEWTAPLRWLLADELKVGYSVSPEKAAYVEKKAIEWMTIVTGWDRESEPIQFGMDWRYN